MKKITLWLFLLFACSQMNAQLWNIVSCGTGGSTTYGPMYSTTTANANNRTAVIYPASQLTGIVGQTLNAMYFNRTTATGSMAGTPNFKIYIKEVTAADFGAGAIDWATQITGSTLVYDSNPAAAVGSNSGWKMFPLATNFLYTGQNLAVFYEYLNTTASSSISWNYEFTAPCANTANSNTSKYSNNTSGTLATSLTSSDYRRPMIGFDFVVSCNAPNTLVSSNLTTTSVDISWTENAIQPQNGYEYYYSTANTAPLSSQTPSGSTTTGISTTSLTSLTPATTYYVWVRGNCGASDKSVWSGPIALTTSCVEVAAFVENFDTSPTGIGNLPVCWSKVGTSANVYTNTGALAPMSPANRLYMNISTTTTAFAVMPPVSNLQANTHRLKFKTYCTTANKVLSIGYFTIPGSESSYVELQQIQIPSAVVANTQEFTVIPTGIPAGVSQLVFNLVAGASTTAYIDDVKWEVNSACVEPSTLTVSALTNNSATLGWTNGGPETEWDIQYGLTGFSLGSGTIVNGVTVNPHVLNGLLANTSYQFYVRAVCAGPQNSSWFGPFLFKTLCDDVSAFSESFEGYATGSTNPLPDCWTKGGTALVYITTGAAAPMSPANRLYMFASGTANPPTESYAILPGLLNLQANTHRLKFKGYATVAGRFIEVGYLTDPNNVSSFVQLQEVFLPSTTVASTQEFTVIPTGIPAGVRYLAIKNPGFPSATTTAYIDDVIWEAIPSCVETTFLTSTLVTNTTATLGWTEGGTASQWEIEYGPTGFVQGAGTLVLAPTNPLTLTSLLPNTTYDFYVRAVCSTTDFSAWTGASTFKTQCDEVTAFSENFEGYATGSANPLPDCWTKGGTGSVYLSTGALAPMSPVNRIYMFASGTTPTQSYAILPPVSNLQANTHRLKFKGYATAAGRFVEIGYLVDPSDVSTFVLIQEVYLPSTVVANTQEFTIMPTGIPSGVKCLAIKNPGFPSSTTTAYIDDVIWEPTPACIEPTFLGSSMITSNTASIGWTEGGTATQWEIEYGAPGFAQGTGTVVSVSSNPFTLTGLTSNTNYQYYVRAVCNTTSSSVWTGPSAFKTQCDDVTAFSESFEGYATGSANPLPDCWTKGGTGSVYLSSGAVAPMSPVNRLYMFASGTANPPTESYAIMPAVSNLQANTHRLRFKGYATLANRTVQIGYLTDPSDVSSFVLIQDVPLPSTIIANTQEFIVVPTGIPAGVKHIVIKNPGFTASSATMYFDDVSWELIPTSAPACAANVLATPNASCGNFATSISWDSSAMAEAYSITIGTTTGGNDILDNVNIGNVTSYSFTGSLNTTYYYKIVPFNSFGPSVGCVEQNFMTAANGCYCLPSGTSNLSYINNFSTTLGATNITNSASGFSTANYGDYTTLSTSLASGQNFNFNVEIIGGTVGCAIWIDWNNDLNFDAVEMMYSTTSYGNGPFSGAVAVPSMTPNGNYRMRVMIDYNDSNPGNDDACSFTSGRGEVEDYIVTVDNTLNSEAFENSNFVFYPNPVKDVLNLSYTSEMTSIKVINLLGQVVLTKNVENTSTQIDMSSLTNGAYMVHITIGNVVKTIKIIKN